MVRRMVPKALLYDASCFALRSTRSVMLTSSMLSTRIAAPLAHRFTTACTATVPMHVGHQAAQERGQPFECRLRNRHHDSQFRIHTVRAPCFMAASQRYANTELSCPLQWMPHFLGYYEDRAVRPIHRRSSSRLCRATSRPETKRVQHPCIPEAVRHWASQVACMRLVTGAAHAQSTLCPQQLSAAQAVAGNVRIRIVYSMHGDLRIRYQTRDRHNCACSHTTLPTPAIRPHLHQRHKYESQQL